jgi:hypothetical protein
VGEIPIRIGASAADDAAGGVLFVSARETVRNAIDGPVEGLSPSVSTVSDDDFTSENTRNTAGGLAIVVDRAGINQVNAAYPQGGPMNANVAAAYFPFSEGWKGGTAWASVNNGPIDMFVGSAGITFSSTIGIANTANVRPSYYNPATAAGPPAVPAGVNNDGPAVHNYDVSNAIHNGHNFVSIPGVTDTRQQGLLFAMHAKNEDNFATVSALADGSGWHLNTRSNSQNDTNQGEPKPFSFVFVPLGTPNVTMGAMWGASSTPTAVGDPVPILKSGSNFTVTKMEAPNGRFRLTIDGQNPSTGVLLVNGDSNLNGSGGLPADNNLTYTPDGDGWIIYSDDLQNVNTAPLNGQNGQIDEPVPYFHFAFMPFNAPPGTPNIPTPAWDKGDVFGYSTNVQEIRATGNNQDDADGPDLLMTVASAPAGLNVQPLALNRADNRIHVNGAIPSGGDGIMLATVSEGFRDNTATGGVRSYGIASAYLSGNDQWVTATSVADQFAGQRLLVPVPIAGEANYNYSMAFFGRDSGFDMGSVEAVTGGTGLYSVSISGVNSLTDGVLMANNAVNEDNFVTVAPKLDGTGWDVQNWDNGGFTQNFGFNYVYLPYDTENLVAGRVNPDGSLINSTPTGEFTLVREAAGTYLLTVDGRTSSQGMLLLNAEASDHTLAYEPAGNSFRIFALDPVTQAEFEGTVAEMTLVDTNFQFAFIDYVTPPTVPGGDFLAADFNENGVVDGNDLTAWRGGFGDATATKSQGDADADGDVDGGDFLVWQQQVGMTPATAAAGAIPEPAAAVMAAVGLALVAAFRRRDS